MKHSYFVNPAENAPEIIADHREQIHKKELTKL